MSYLATFTKELIDTSVKEFRKKNNREKINKYIIDPVLRELFSKCALPIFVFFIMHIMIIILLIYIAKNMNRNSS